MAAQEPKPDEEQQMGQEVFNELKAKGEIVESSPLYDKLQPIADAITPGWVVALPLYAIEIKLALASPSGAPADLSHASIQRRYEAIDEELETAASLAPVPPPGSTGEAAEYFQQPSTLFRGCAEPFYRRFLPSPSPELRAAARDWLELVRSRHMTCKKSDSAAEPTAIGKSPRIPEQLTAPLDANYLKQQQAV